MKGQLTTITQEFSEYKDDAERTIKQSSAALATSETALAMSESALTRANKGNVELESGNQQLRDQLMGLAKEFQSFKESTEDSTSASKATLDKTARDLAAVSKSKIELETANAKLKEQLTTITQQFNDYKDDAEDIIKSSSADLTGKDRSLTELQMMHKKDTASIEALNKQVSEKTDGITALEAANALYREQLMALAQEFAAYKESSQQMMEELNVNFKGSLSQSAAVNAELESANGQLKKHLATSVSEYQEFKDAKEKHMAELSAQLDEEREKVSTLQSQGSKDTEEIAAVRSS